VTQQLWVGLGNPEPGMATNRHNIGFMALDVIAIRHGFSPWRRRFKGVIAEGTVGATKILALKPLTYMNASGESVQEAAAFYKLPIEAITAFHDELDLVPGKVRVKQGGGAAGHNGLRSMDKMLGSQDYRRVRLGIGHPGTRERVLGYVLGNFSADDRPWLIPLLDAVADAAGLLAEGKHSEFMTNVALKTQASGNGASGNGDIR
jgi:PTH1 family peptidyl-tRNA hydrolase